eukprot:CAMPEP_0197013496 /NCGR_PEP_ID=MMETSP1380-20130617/66542_1 /TAXON_ID=5936 /ORGANISM="Euplotes crassus, Strain CT5" /LENGTH=962 /DNA_ID=CAMNT_0042437789 /DNA_START=144 /DNA_END=3032 /DNA_ORIENTATION=+
MKNKKHVWKLIYTYILGYEVDFGHLEALNLINASKYSEKCTGYIATGIMLNEMNADPELLEMVINSIKTDLTCGNEVYESLALSTIANIGATEFARSLGSSVQRLAFCEDYKPSYFIQKKACLCLYSFFKKNKEIFNREVWASAFDNELLTQKNYGVLLSACGLIHGVLVTMGTEGFEGCVTKLIYILSRIHDYATDYLYYRTPSPWLQIKALKILRLFPPPEDEEALNAINEVLISLVTGTEVGTNVNKNNADHAILFEAIRLVIHYKDKANEIVRKDILALLGRFINVREANIRYLALETMARLSHNEVISSYLMKEHMNTIIYSLRDPDLSIRRRSLDLIFALCDQDSATNVVNELLVYLNENDYTLKEELVLKIAILAEKFALNLNWYVDVIVKLITTESAGDYVSDEIRFRVYQILTGFGEVDPNYELQKYAALQIFLALQVDFVHETMIKLGASVLPEFGHHIADAPGKSHTDQFEVLDKHFTTSNISTKGMILTALMKFALQDSSLIQHATTIFTRYSRSWNEDIQQRAIEYLRMLKFLEKDESYREFILESFEPLPTYPDHMQNNSVLIKRMSQIKKKKNLAATGKDDTEKDIATEATEEYKAQVSSALSRGKSKEASSTSGSDIFSGDTGSKTESGAFDDILGLGDSSGSNVLGHPFAKANPGDFSSSQTVDINSEAEELSMNGDQDSKWKNLIPISCTDGTIFEDDNIKVNMRFNISKYVTRVLVEYVSTTASTLDSVQAMLKVPDGMKAMISDTKYPTNDTDNPKAMMTVLHTGSIKEDIKMAIKYESGFGDPVKQVFRVPVLVNKFIDKVDMEQDRFDHLWNDISTNRPDSFEKVDLVMSNPARGSGASQMDVLKKLAKLLSMCMNLKVLPPTDKSNFSKICAVGQVHVADEDADFPKNADDINNGSTVPLMVECEFYTDINEDEFRCSIRSNDKVRVTASFAQLFKLFV